MTTFQVIVYAVIGAFSYLFPIDSTSHFVFLSGVIAWPYPDNAVLGVIKLGVALAIFFHFRHDWLSFLSSFFRMLFTFKKPSSIDDRILIFIGYSFVPLVITDIFFKDVLSAIEVTPLFLSAALLFSFLPFMFAEKLNRKTKSYLNWGAVDSLLLGVFQVLHFIPGAGRQVGVLTLGMLRNYQWDAVLKFSLLTFIPTLLWDIRKHFSNLSFHLPQASDQLSWLSFWVGITISFLVSLVAITAYLKMGTHGSIRRYGLYRLALAGATALTFILK